MKTAQRIVLALVSFVFLFSFTGCKKEGPLEKAGKKIDKTLKKAGDKFKHD